ncbi:hypothetical protein SpCBS45565_g03502 [Spizellomyces sp. 'palustris']|nr:hypothetical protein SpCBS45565_g03502 [Spizellomyces sp. 'palustris']
MSHLQRIGVLAYQVFAAFPGRHPEADAILDRLCSLIRDVTLGHLKVKPAQYPVEYYPIYESSVYTMCVFVLKRGTTMPTHDHPKMTVFSKIISGDLHVRTYEFAKGSTAQAHVVVDPRTGDLVQARPTKAGLNRIISASDPESLLLIRPEGGPNMHSFTAVSEEVVLLDIIGPPYNSEDRPCTYFREVSWGEGCKLVAMGVEAAAPGKKSKNKKKKKRRRAVGPERKTDAMPIQENESATNPCPPPPPPTPTLDLTPPPVRSSNTTISNSSSEASLDLLNTSGTDEMCWLVEDPDVDYRCVERLYRGESVAKVERYANVELGII